MLGVEGKRSKKDNYVLEQQVKKKKYNKKKNQIKVSPFCLRQVKCHSSPKKKIQRDKTNHRKREMKRKSKICQMKIFSKKGKR